MTDLEDVSRWLSTGNPPQTPLVRVFSEYLTAQEATQIFLQFQSNNWVHNGQVLWSGVHRGMAHEWADKHHLQTLTTAMGPSQDHYDQRRDRRGSERLAFNLLLQGR